MKKIQLLFNLKKDLIKKINAAVNIAHPFGTTNIFDVMVVVRNWG